MLTKLLLFAVLTTPADDATAALALAKAGRNRADESKSAALEAQPARPQPAPAAALPPDPRSRVLTYAELKGWVERGQPATLYVGVAGARGGSYVVQGYVESLPGKAAGVYACWLQDGEAVFERLAPASAPAFSTPIRDAIYNFVTPSACAGGQCPTPRGVRR